MAAPKGNQFWRQRSADRPDQRSETALAYRRWYKTARWQRRRAAQLAAEPLCANCLRHGRVTPATVADHVEPHSGDYDKFWCGKLQSLCKPCHDSDKQREERGRPRQEIGVDGWPVS